MGIVIAILVVYIVFLQECKRPRGYQIPEGKVLVSQSFLDSLEVIANLPPDTIPGDTIRIKGDIVYVPAEVPEPVPIDPETNFYADSIVNDSIDVRAEITTFGIITKWDWFYRPITFTTETIIEKSVPLPVPYEVPVYKLGLYASLRVGGGLQTGKFLFGADLDLVTKKRSIYGIQFTRFGAENLIGFKFGTKLFGK